MLIRAKSMTQVECSVITLSSLHSEPATASPCHHRIQTVAMNRELVEKNPVNTETYNAA